jgi:hypothetical protein
VGPGTFTACHIFFIRIASGVGPRKSGEEVGKMIPMQGCDGGCVGC